MSFNAGSPSPRKITPAITPDTGSSMLNIAAFPAPISLTPTISSTYANAEFATDKMNVYRSINGSSAYTILPLGRSKRLTVIPQNIHM